MGTLFQTVYEEEASELRMLGYLGYDATTFGNHEFDYRSKGLAQMLDTAAASGDVVPSLLVCNVDWSEMNDERQLLKDAFDHYGVKDYEVIEKGGVKSHCLEYSARIPFPVHQPVRLSLKIQSRR